MRTKRITRTLLRENAACYTDERIAELVPKRGVTLRQVLETDLIPDADKLWVATRDGVFPEPAMAAWLAGIVERALGRVNNPDPGSLAVVLLLRRIAAGEEVSIKERYAARSAAWSAARSAAWAAAASRYTWETTESKQQVQDLLTLLED